MNLQKLAEAINAATLDDLATYSPEQKQALRVIMGMHADGGKTNQCKQGYTWSATLGHCVIDIG